MALLPPPPLLTLTNAGKERKQDGGDTPARLEHPAQGFAPLPVGHLLRRTEFLSLHKFQNNILRESKEFSLRVLL